MEQKENIFSFKQINIDELNREEFDSIEDKSVFTTVEWLKYIEEDSKAQLIILRITSNDDFVGYFTGAVIKKFGIKIVGSPFNGWSTCYMGFDTVKDIDRLALAKQVSEYLYKNYKCKYIEITDRKINKNEAEKKGFTCLPMHTLELRIDKTDEELFKVFKTDCRNFIRQFERRGASLEIAEPDTTFVDEYYDQLEDVFAKQGLVPTYSKEKVACLTKHISKSENLLCLRVRNPEGKSIATSIFFGYKKKFFFWGGASYRSEQNYRPNEYMIWTAIKYWRERGCSIFDMVGVRDYKKKFGAEEIEYVKLVFSKSKLLLTLRNMAKAFYLFMLKVKGFIKRKK